MQRHVDIGARAGARLSRRTIVIAITLASGCASNRTQLVYSPDELREEVSKRAPDVPASAIVVPYEVDERDVSLARRTTRPMGVRGDQVRALIFSLFDPAVFGLRYMPTVTATARETLASYEGNCLSLASVFVGLARGLGFRAFFLDASARISETSESDPGLVVNAGHITAMVEVEKYRWYLDFDRTLGHLKNFTVLSDVEALAHFYNNRGYERIEEARVNEVAVDWEEAASDFLMATRIDPQFTRAWNNLGIAYARTSRPDEAEGAYRRAIASGRDVGAPYNNLGALYLASGKTAQALAVLREAVRIAPDSAHIQYNLGRALLMAGEREAAVAALRRSAELKNASATALLDKLAWYERTHGLHREE